MLDAQDRTSELGRTDPDDTPMSSSAENIHSRSSHASRRLRALSGLQGNTSCMCYLAVYYLSNLLLTKPMIG